jgi:hypothetical protein
MSIDIRPINILFDTNIPGKKIIPFTKSLLYNPLLKDTGNLNEYPYFTTDFLFPYSYLSSLPYEKQVSFFFNKSEMLKLLKMQNASEFKKNPTEDSNYPEILTEDEKKNKQDYEKIKQDEKKDKEKKDKEKKEETKNRDTNNRLKNVANAVIIANKIKTNNKNEEEEEEEEGDDNDEKYLTKQTKFGNKNVLIMLRLLFPTKYPIVGNIFSSFNSIILKRSEFNFSFSDILPSFLKNKLIEGNASYSYVKVDGKIYTVAQVIWLNDIYNHKEYSELINKFINLNNWKKKALEKLDADIKIKLESFISEYSNAFDKDEINYINEQSNKIDNNNNNKDTDREIYYNKYQSEFISFKKTIKNFIEAINEFKNAINEFKIDPNDSKEKKYENLSDSAKNLVEIYKSLIKFGANFFKTKEKYNNIINNVSRDLENIRIKEYIRDKYISKPGIDLDYEKDDKKYSEVLKSSFKEYTNFADIIKKFKSPNKESSNVYLQKTFDEFLENREQHKGMFNFLLNPYNIHINPYEKIRKKENKDEQKQISKEKKQYHLRKNTGVTILPSTNEKEPGYEIYVQLNVIGGELNDTNISVIDCLYQSDSLGNKLEYLINETLHNSWDINSTRLYIDISQANLGDDKKGDKNGDKKEDIKEDKKEDIKKDDKKQGGNTRKLRQQIIQTRKNYNYKYM